MGNKQQNQGGCMKTPLKQGDYHQTDLSRELWDIWGFYKITLLLLQYYYYCVFVCSCLCVSMAPTGEYMIGITFSTHSEFILQKHWWFKNMQFKILEFFFYSDLMDKKKERVSNIARICVFVVRVAWFSGPISEVNYGVVWQVGLSERWAMVRLEQWAPLIKNII